MKNCWITLGAYGDICNTLPLVWNDFQQGNHPTMMVAQEFESILDGVGYCEKLVWPGPYSESARAVDYVANELKTFDDVYLVQCYGTTIDRVTDSFAKEAWRLVGMSALWGKLPLVFDRRNTAREIALMASLGIPGNRPAVLVSTSGRSSPFPFANELYDVIRPLNRDFDIISLNEIRAERFFDLIKLFECAHCLITTDSGPLHLANSVPELPVIALITDRPDLWHGSPKRGNHIAYIRYNETLARLRQIPDLIRGAKRLSLPIHNTNPKLVHVWSEYNRTNQGAIRRHEVAKKTWHEEFKGCHWVACVVHENALARNGNMVNEQKPVPFVKDLFAEAAKQCDPGDIIVFSNDDTCFTKGLTHVVLNNVRKHGAMWGARWECHSVPRPLSYDEMRHGYRHCGADIFAFTLEWWNEHQSEIPDFLLTFEVWDLVLKKLILMTGGIEVQDTCYHEIHESFWHMQHNRNCTGNLYNRELGQQWLAAHNIRWEDAFK